MPRFILKFLRVIECTENVFKAGADNAKVDPAAAAVGLMPAHSEVAGVNSGGANTLSNSDQTMMTGVGGAMKNKIQ